MNELAKSFENNGYAILDDVVPDDEIIAIERNLASLSIDKVGTRNVLITEWCGRLAIFIKRHAIVSSYLPENAVAVQCTYFEKSLNQNWLVSIHRDYSIPLKGKINAPGWSQWSEKEGVIYGRPPESVLRSLVAIRVHLEDNTEYRDERAIAGRTGFTQFARKFGYPQKMPCQERRYCANAPFTSARVFQVTGRFATCSAFSIRPTLSS